MRQNGYAVPPPPASQEKTPARAEVTIRKKAKIAPAVGWPALLVSEAKMANKIPEMNAKRATTNIPRAMTNFKIPTSQLLNKKSGPTTSKHRGQQLTVR